MVHYPEAGSFESARSGFADYAREGERERDLRALVSMTPGLSEIIQSDWKRAARLYARFGITESLFRSPAADSTVSPGVQVNQAQAESLGSSS